MEWVENIRDIEIRTIFSILAIIISIASLYSTRRFWFSTHRPIVTAEIVMNSSGIGVGTFNLIVYNSGNRPAVNITLSATALDIESIFSSNATSNNKNIIRAVFSPSNKIPLLLNGKETRTAFSSYSNQDFSDAGCLEYESELPIIINYSDLNGQSYVSHIDLRMREAEGFGGSVWN